MWGLQLCSLTALEDPQDSRQQNLTLHIQALNTDCLTPSPVL